MWRRLLLPAAATASQAASAALAAAGQAAGRLDGLDLPADPRTGVSALGGDYRHWLKEVQQKIPRLAAIDPGTPAASAALTAETARAGRIQQQVSSNSTVLASRSAQLTTRLGDTLAAEQTAVAGGRRPGSAAAPGRQCVDHQDDHHAVAPAGRGLGQAGRLLGEVNRMSAEHDKGDIDVRIPAGEFTGDYATMAQGVNDMVAGHIAVKKKAMAVVEGDFDAPLEQFPGKKAFINDTIEQVRRNLQALIEEAFTLATAAVEGRLEVRADTSRHHGGFREIIQGVNNTLDAVIGPLTEVSGSWLRWSRAT
ncbi:MAG TPA: hypothetical protein VI248_05655 [Kineosporiaceae bacterium]